MWWPALISGMTISGLSDTGVSPGRSVQPLIFGLAMAIWAFTHFVGHDSRDPSGLTLAHQPAHSPRLQTYQIPARRQGILFMLN